MHYSFATEDLDYSDFASGRVLYNQPGQPALPVRLTSEIFQRCYAHWQAGGGQGPVRLYDPCCGTAYHLTVLGLLHGSLIQEITAVDIDATILETAARNLGLLSLEGMDLRIAEIRGMLAAFGKDAHREALATAMRLRELLVNRSRPIRIHTFRADATGPTSASDEMAEDEVDVVLMDVPYGWHTTWQFDGGKPPVDPLLAVLEALQTRLAPIGIAAVVCDKEQKAAHPSFKRLERIRIGKRQAFIFQRV